MTSLDERGTLLPAPQPSAFVEVRGPDSGHLYGRLDPVRLILVVKRKGGPVETIDLRQLLGRVKA